LQCCSTCKSTVGPPFNRKSFTSCSNTFPTVGTLADPTNAYKQTGEEGHYYSALTGHYRQPSQGVKPAGTR
jgi:hypothetical protein